MFLYKEINSLEEIIYLIRACLKFTLMVKQNFKISLLTSLLFIKGSDIIKCNLAYFIISQGVFG